MRIVSRFFLAFALVAALGAALPAQAQQAPPAPAAADEAALFNYLQGQVGGRVSIPDQRSAQLIQPEGRDYQEWHRTTLKWIGGVAILGMAVILLLFFLIRGKVRIDAGPSGRRIQRFNGLDRFAHWLSASCFVVLGITGLNIAFGRSLLLPLMSPEAFTAWSAWAKLAHNFVSFPFTLGIVLMLLLWLKDNIPNGRDIAWFKGGGGLFGHGHPPAERFNAGQKLIFWSVVLGGLAIAATGYLLMFPFTLGLNVNDMQLAQILHGGISVVLIAIILGHIYIGSVGMEGAFAAMGSGKVDLNWAKEHHSLWVERMAGRQKRDPQGSQAD